jgi:hypothetical protein
MPLDGLRAWIGEVERKLGMRTRVFLVLSLIAIGGAGAAIYLAIDANRSSVSESDVQALQGEIEARVGAGGGAELAQVEAEVSALKAELEKLRGTGGSGQGGGGSAGGGSGGGGSGSGGSGARSGGASGSSGGHANGSGSSGSGTGGNSSGSGASTGAVPDTNGKGDAARLGELLQEAKEESEKAEHKK